MTPQASYDTIGRGYGEGRVPDARIASVIWNALGDASSVVNVGAGAGSYEPWDRTVIAVEPSEVMIAQRAAGAAPAIQASAVASGEWDQRYGDLRLRPTLDVGLRLICADLGDR